MPEILIEFVDMNGSRHVVTRSDDGEISVEKTDDAQDASEDDGDVVKDKEECKWVA